MTSKDYINCADAISNLRLDSTALNQIITEFSVKFDNKYGNFNSKTFRKYIIDKYGENRRERLKDKTSPELKLIE